MGINLSLLGDTLIVKSEYELKRLITTVKGGTWNKRNSVWMYPKSAILMFFNKIPAEKMSYSEDVYHEFKRQRTALHGLKALKEKKSVLPEHAFLMEHQVRAVEISKIYNKFAYFLDTGK